MHTDVLNDLLLDLAPVPMTDAGVGIHSRRIGAVKKRWEMVFGEINGRPVSEDAFHCVRIATNFLLITCRE